MMSVKRALVVLVTFAMVAAFSLPVFAEGQQEGGGGTEEMFIPVISKGFQHQFWQTVNSGAQDAAEEFGVEIQFEGPTSEAAIQEQVQMLQNSLAQNPDAIALAALDTQAVMDGVREAMRRDIPIVGFDSGVPNAPEGAIAANAATNNQAAAGLAAEQMFPEIQSRVQNASRNNPVTIVVLSQDATSASVTNRGFGFRDRMIELITSETNKSRNHIRVQGNPAYVADNSPQSDDPAVVIDMIVPASPRTQDVTASAEAIFNRVEDDNIAGMFLSNEGTVVGALAATNDGAELASTYDDLVVVGFDAGAAQKNAVREGYFLGSITQDPYQIGYKAVELAYRAAQGEEVSDVDTGARFYNSENMDDEEIAPLLYD
jgi:ribose transport system substrate-binding protein